MESVVWAFGPLPLSLPFHSRWRPLPSPLLFPLLPSSRLPFLPFPFTPFPSPAPADLSLHYKSQLNDSLCLCLMSHCSHYRRQHSVTTNVIFCSVRAKPWPNWPTDPSPAFPLFRLGLFDFSSSPLLLLPPSSPPTPDKKNRYRAHISPTAGTPGRLSVLADRLQTAI